MRSPLIENASYIKDKHLYSELQVLRSAAGYYIGTVYHNPEGFAEPGSRDSVSYYSSEETAQYELDHNTFKQRLHP